MRITQRHVENTTHTTQHTHTHTPYTPHTTHTTHTAVTLKSFAPLWRRSQEPWFHMRGLPRRDGSVHRRLCKLVELRHREFTPARALLRESRPARAHLIVEQAVDVPVPQPTEVIVENDVATAPACTHSALQSRIAHQFLSSSTWLQHLPSPLQYELQ